MKRTTLLLVASLAAYPFAAQSEPLTIAAAVEQAQQKTLRAVTAREDVLLASLEHASALSAILPRVDLVLTAEEIFGTSLIVEARNPSQIDETADSVEPFTFGPFVDGHANNFSHPRFELTLVARQLVFDGGRWWLAIDRAGELEKERRAALAEVLNDVRLEAVMRFYQLERERRSLAALGSQIEVDRELLRLAETRRTEGAGLANDVAYAKRNLILDEIARDRRAITEDDARRSLNLLLGRPAEDPIELATPELDEVRDQELPALEALIERARQQHPTFKRINAQLAASRKTVGIEAADYWPEVSLDLRYTRESRRPDRVFADPTGNFFAVAGISAAWNIFSGRATSIAVQRAEIELKKLHLLSADVERRVSAGVSAAHRRAARLAMIHQRAREAPGAAEEAVRLARTLYREGRGRALEVRDAEQELTQARLMEIDTRLELRIALEALRHAVGVEDEIR